MNFSPAPILLISFFTLASAQTCGNFAIAGSSTVRPVAEAWAASYADICPSAVITIEGGGSSNGAGRVCADTSRGEPVEIGDMSRGWKDSEAVADDPPYLYKCLIGDTSRSAFQIDVAIDGLSVATKAGGAGDLCIQSLGGLTTDQLRWVFTSYNDTALEASGWDPMSLVNSDGDETTHLWSELSPDCPAVDIKVAGADDQSGTYEYFLETILTDFDNGETFGHGDYFNSAVDEDLVMYLEDNEDAIAYFGYAYYYSNADDLSAVSVMNSAGEYVAPTPESVGDGSYNPLARRIYMNLLNEPSALELTVPYVEHGFSDDALVAGTGYVSLSETEKAKMIARVTV